jgi:tetratricopeptide (TPR) repeat protein
MTLKSSICAIAAIACAHVAFAQHEHEAHVARHARTPALGTVVFPNSGNAAAQEPFVRGVAFLHSFEYDEAGNAFREARRGDPGFALAAWMEALTYSHMLWAIEDLPAARAALTRLGPTATERLAKARSPRERMFGAAVEAYFADVARPQRIRGYADSLRRYAQADASDNEAAAFAAHALLLNTLVAENGAQRDSLTREGIALAQRVVSTNPKHPGATHYLIHLYDSPTMAAQGLAAARAYDMIAPGAEHALHMPSHIYLQLGLWDDVVKANERAWAASRAAQAPDWHAFSWLQYGYLQQGRVDAARGLIDTARKLLGERPGAYADASVILSRLQFQYASETGRWGEIPVSQPRYATAEPASDRDRVFRTIATYWLAVDAAQRNDTTALASAAAAWLGLADSLRANERYVPGRAALALQIDALVARTRGDRARYLASLNASAEKEREMPPFVGPPERLLSLELLAKELLADGRPADAARAYEDVLKKCPNRAQAVLGLARARTAQGTK